MHIGAAYKISLFILSLQCTGAKIAIEKQNYTVSEGDGAVNVCIIVDSESLERTVDFFLYAVGDSASSRQHLRDFYIDLDLKRTFNKTILRVCVDVSIIDDNRVENSEQFRVTVSSRDPDVIITIPTAIVTIYDNDEPVIGFAKAEYRGKEGQTVEVCITVDNILERSVSILVNVSVEDESTEGMT